MEKKTDLQIQIYRNMLNRMFKGDQTNIVKEKYEVIWMLAKQREACSFGQYHGPGL